MDEPVLVPVTELDATVKAIFVAAGCDAAEAARIADGLVAANLTGHDSHGVGMVLPYLQWLRAGYVVAGRNVEVVTDSGAFALLDGGFGFGQTIAPQATAFGVERAQRDGTCIVALRNSGHIGRVGAYAETALEAGLISIHIVNVAGSSMVAPFGGVERRFSTAPIAIGAPLPDRPIVLDFATALVAAGKVQVASYGGKAVPADALIGPDGTTSNDPHLIYGDYAPGDPRDPSAGLGALRAFGEHKGSGLALMCELLGGAFTGGGMAGGPDRNGRGRINNGMLSIYLSPHHFGTQEEFERMGREYVEWVASSRPAAAGGEVLLPGEPEARNRTTRLADGVPLPPTQWAAIQQAAREVGAV